MEGLAAAKDAGLQVKINAVALKGVNDDEVDRLVAWCGGEGYDLTFIEVMPMGEIGEQRVDQYWPLSMLRAQLAENWALEEIDYRTGGPARSLRVEENGGHHGFVTQMTHHFCERCKTGKASCRDKEGKDVYISVAGV